jgi:hypothetical protein
VIPGRCRDSNTTAGDELERLRAVYLVAKPDEGRRFSFLSFSEPRLVYEKTTRTSLMTSEPELR